MFENPKLTFDIGSATMETNIKLSGKEIKKYTRNIFYNYYCLDGCLGIDDWDFILCEQCEAYKQLKKGETFFIVTT